MVFGGRIFAAVALVALLVASHPAAGSAVAARVPEPSPADLRLRDELRVLAARSDAAAFASGGFEVSLQEGSERLFLEIDFDSGHLRTHSGDCADLGACQVSDGRNRFWWELDSDRGTRRVLTLVGRPAVTHITPPWWMRELESTWTGLEPGALLREVAGPGSVLTRVSRTESAAGQVRYRADWWIASQRNRITVVADDGRLVELRPSTDSASLHYVYGSRRIPLPPRDAVISADLWFAGRYALTAPRLVHGVARRLRDTAADLIGATPGIDPVRVIQRSAAQRYRRGGYPLDVFIRREPRGIIVFFKNRVRVYAEAVVWDVGADRVIIERLPRWRP